MTTIVKFECGCIGTQPDSNMESTILESCEDGTPGSKARPMKGKAWQPYEFRDRLHEAFVESHDYNEIRNVLMSLVREK
jgi:hypothetical protein